MHITNMLLSVVQSLRASTRGCSRAVRAALTSATGGSNTCTAKTGMFSGVMVWYHGVLMFWFVNVQ